jgi:hypothetical protein
MVQRVAPGAAGGDFGGAVGQLPPGRDGRGRRGLGLGLDRLPPWHPGGGDREPSDRLRLRRGRVAVDRGPGGVVAEVPAEQRLRVLDPGRVQPEIPEDGKQHVEDELCVGLRELPVPVVEPGLPGGVGRPQQVAAFLR